MMSAKKILMSVGFAEVVAIMFATAFAQTNPPPAVPTAPPSAPAKRSAADLEKLVAPIALYPDPLIATVLPASAYPLEVVQAARFVKDTNNIAKLDAQPWDPNVKEVAQFPDVIAQMSDNIEWMNDLGDAFVNQPKELMDAVQTMRSKAQASGSLKTTPEQVVVVTNMVTTNLVQQETVYVTNQVVQIQPAQPQVIYVPQYNPTVVYGGYPVAYPGYYYPPASSVAAASVVSFGVGMAVGAIAANNCDWHGGGVYGGRGYGDVDVDVNRNTTVNRNVNNANVQNRNTQAQGQQGQKWQPDQSRLKNSGSPSSSAQSREARGWSSPSGQTAAGSARAATGATGGQGGTSAGQGRSTTPNSASRPSTPSTTPNANRSASQPASTSRNTGGASASQSSAFSSMQSGAADRSASQRGSTSRGSGGGGARAGGGGGARGGGGRR
jgi:hypothetical protein